MGSGLKAMTARFLAERNPLMAFIYGLVRDPEAAEDILQEVWIRLADAVERGIEIEKLDRWCRRTARNLILHHWRDRRQEVIVDSELVGLLDKAFEEQEAQGSRWGALWGVLSECVDKAPEAARALFRLKYENSLSISEIAARLQTSYRGVLMRLVRLRRLLLNCVEKHLPMGGPAS